MEPMIEIDNVSMRFRMAGDRPTGLKEYVVRRLSGKIQYNEFEALGNVSFTVGKGEVVGLIGHNGAGKSTLLKCISGILRPTEGKIRTGGSVVPMLELGSGFDFDMTGRENIYLNGAVLGFTEKFLNERFDEIVEFSELGQFIDVPLRNYSSGMIARIAFSIATMVSPEILIVDEVLSVGDAAFQEKSYHRMMELMSGGTTVLFVSHSLDQIRQMCSRAVWLDHGSVRMLGDTAPVCDAYEASIRHG